MDFGGILIHEAGKAGRVASCGCIDKAGIVWLSHADHPLPAPGLGARIFDPTGAVTDRSTSKV